MPPHPTPHATPHPTPHPAPWRDRALPPGTDLPFVDTLVAPLDRYVPELRAALADGAYATAEHRALASGVKTLLTAFLHPRSRWHTDSGLLPPARRLLDQLATLQGADGLFGGDNLASPPDSSFTVNDVCVATQLIDAYGNSPEGEGGTGPAGLRAGLAAIRRAVTPALLTGGVHTPNHRWELCAALARLHRLDPDPRLPARVGQWLAEGVDLQPDGMYSERSPLYAAYVTNPSLLAVADALDRPELLDPVRRNLDAFARLFDEDGAVESVHSRRQDQRTAFDGAGFLLPYRRFAVREGRADYAAVVTGILARPVGAELAVGVLAETLLDPTLARPLPPSPPPTDPAAGAGPARIVLADSGLARWRTGRRTVTVYGGGDNARFPDIASGLATNPTFLRFRQGAAVLDAVRLSVNFFGLGPFRGDGLRVADDGRCSLTRTTTARFYQPLPEDRRHPGGGYELGGEGRFFAAMDFAHRPADEHRLRVDAEVVPTGAGVDVRLGLTGVPTSFVLELTFRGGGVLAGARPVPGSDAFELADGTGSYTVGEDTIRFGPGNGTGPAQPALFDDGERFTYLGARDTLPGTRVRITGRVPGAYTLTLTGAGPRP
ncbi:hypothetical protein AB0P17_10225 [Streptomyces sp. NPDC088124]|uniref:hypothetical protein n=1 Tax=Streptomyces sp. NPDC088124 TaxID=3154654 RepID=UPI00343AE02D